MKKTLGLVLCLGIFLSGCNQKQETEENTSSTTATIETIQSEEPSESFENGVLTTREFTLDLKEAKIIKSPAESGYGLYITFDFKNDSDTNLVPEDILTNYLSMRQTNETSVVTLENNYYSLDAFSDPDDTKAYNERVDMEKALSNEILSGKTVEVFVTYSLDNLDNPAELIATINDGQEVAYKIGIPELDTPVEYTKETESDETYSADDHSYDMESDVNAKWHEAKNQGMSDVDAYNYANGTSLTETEYYGYDEYNENVEAAEQYASDFEAENGRAPSSGETQLEWLQEQGLVE